MAVRFLEAILLAAFFSGAGYVFGRLFGVVIQFMIEREADMPAIRASITKRSSLERNLENRVRDRRKEMAGLDRSITELVRKKNGLQQDAAALAATPDRILRQVGEELAGATRFLALVYNKYAEGGKGAVDNSWTVPQEIEVWTVGLSEARVELEKRYPPSFGYVISSLLVAPDESKEKDAPALDFDALLQP